MSSLPTETAKEPLLFKTEKAYLVSFVNVCSQKKPAVLEKQLQTHLRVNTELPVFQC